MIVYAIVAAVALQRLAELVYAARNTRRLLAQGAAETGKAHYPLIVALHASWLACVALFAAPNATINLYWLSIFVALQLARVWVIASLGPYWTTRIITLPNAPLVRRGPYRFMKHPNYLVVVGEIAALPLAFGQWRLALVFTILNAAILAWRIREEDKALASRREAQA